MTKSPRRRVLAAAFAGALVSTLGATGAWAENASETEQLLDQKVDSDILEEIDQTGETELWLRFAGAPDWSEAEAASAKEDKGAAAVEAALEYAEESQADAIDAIEAADAEYETFWGSSTIKVVGDADLLAELVAIDNVEEVLEAPEYDYIEPVETEGDPRYPSAGGAEAQQEGDDWHLDHVRAPELWDEGVDGEGIVVASIDSGVQYDHPALVNQYRGNNGDGTFSHDYNFFDAGGDCGPSEPCDMHGHGTHTMGTMVGDDGEGNRIGVAPGATWMAASAGAEPTLETFLSAGEWIAAPTDSRGNNPDPLMAPHVVNNSWSGFGGYDPFYAEVIDLWHAAGIIPVFAAGNDGEQGCLTVGSPGVYENVIAVGATDIDRVITPWSSKGPGLDAYIRPDVAAPGDQILSSVPGDEYDYSSGTSMAAPHVVGAIALMMSASPVLEGDYGNVYKYLTGEAVPEDDTSCRGSADHNNVYGHGHTDAYEAAHAAPDGRFGTLTGLVTDDGGGAVNRAKLVFEGPVNRIVHSDADGGYAFDRMPAGMYKVTVSKFTYEDTTDWIRVKKNSDAVFDAQLTQLPLETVEGTVVDGSGHGWALDAVVRTAGGETSVLTDPLTGAFSLEIPAEGDWPLTVEVDYPGYETVTVDPADADLIEVPTAPGCLALGYGSDVMEERFDSLAAPEGWEVVNNGEADGWVFDDPWGYGNQTPGSGGFAEANSDAVDPEALVDTDLITAPFDLSAAYDPTLSFASFFIDSEIGGEADLSVSTDGGETWEQVWHTNEDLEATIEDVDLSDWAAETSVKLKFHYTDNDTWAFFWQVDDVRIGCGELEGGLVRGTVTDAEGAPIAGATVTDPATGNIAVTDSTGEYVLFTDAGTSTLEAAAEGFETGTTEVEVTADAVTGADFSLGGAA